MVFNPNLKSTTSTGNRSSAQKGIMAVVFGRRGTQKPKDPKAPRVEVEKAPLEEERELQTAGFGVFNKQITSIRNQETLRTSLGIF